MKEIFVFVVVMLLSVVEGHVWRDISVIQGKSVDRLVGPEDVRYCRLNSLRDPMNTIEVFGRCRMQINRVTAEHAGLWQATIALPNEINTETFYFTVHTIPLQTVDTSVEIIGETAYLTCSVKSPDNLKACKFRDPHNKILLPAESLESGRFRDNGTESIFEDEQYDISCRLRVDELTYYYDHGIWRCVIETDHNKYYGFLRVHVDLTQVIEPVLQPIRTEFVTEVGRSLTMMCTIPASLDYCFFMNTDSYRDVTVYSFSQANSDRFEYVGKGLDAGECGINIFSTNMDHKGQWSCHVGLTPTGNSPPDQAAKFLVSFEGLTANMNRHNQGFHIRVTAPQMGNTMDYCRFTRQDGYTISTRNPGIHNVTNIGNICELTANNIEYHDRQTWFIAARLTGHIDEMSTTAICNYDCIYYDDHPTTNYPDYHIRPSYFSAWLIIVWLIILITISILCGLLAKKKNRTWICEKSSEIKDKICRKICKKNKTPTVNGRPEKVPLP